MRTKSFRIAAPANDRILRPAGLHDPGRVRHGILETFPQARILSAMTKFTTRFHTMLAREPGSRCGENRLAAGATGSIPVLPGGA